MAGKACLDKRTDIDNTTDQLEGWSLKPIEGASSFIWGFSTLSGGLVTPLPVLVSVISSPDGCPCWGNTMGTILEPSWCLLISGCARSKSAYCRRRTSMRPRSLREESKHASSPTAREQASILAQVSWKVYLFVFAFVSCRWLCFCSTSSVSPPWYTWLKVHRGLSQREYHAHKFYFSYPCMCHVHMSAGAHWSQKRAPCGC